MAGEEIIFETGHYPDVARVFFFSLMHGIPHTFCLVKHAQ